MSSMFKKKTGPSLKPKLVPRGRQTPAAAPAPAPSPAPSTAAPSPNLQPAKPADTPRSQATPPQAVPPQTIPQPSRPSDPQQKSRPNDEPPASTGPIAHPRPTAPQQEVAPKQAAHHTITPPQTQSTASTSETNAPTPPQVPSESPSLPVEPSQAVPAKRLPQVSSANATISPTPPSSVRVAPPTAPTRMVPASVSTSSQITTIPSHTTPTPTPASQPAAQLPTPSEVQPTAEPAAVPTPKPTPAKRGRKRKALPETVAVSQDPQPGDVTPTTETPTPQPPAKKPRQRKPRTQPQTTEDGESSAATKPKPKRQRKKPQAGEGGDGSEAGPSSRRESRARSATPSDAEDQMVDLQTLKMSDLTKDLRIGKKFSRHDELRDRERKDRARSSNPASAKASQSPAPNGGMQTSPGVPGGTRPAVPPPRGMGGPQFQIVNGQIVVDQSSLVMDRHARDAADGPLEEIEENEFTHKVTSNSYRNANSSKLKGPNHWSADDTEKFYLALRKYGTDFELISHLFPGRTRRHVKMKFNREEKHHRERIDAALVGPKRVMMDFGEFVLETGKEYEETAEVQAQLRSLEEAQEEARRRVEEEDEELNRKKLEAIHGVPGKGQKDGVAVNASLK